MLQWTDPFALRCRLADLLNNLPKSVRLMEVGPRDGLQNEAGVVPTPAKIAFIEQLAKAGHKRIEITSFVSKKWIPPLADGLEVAEGIKRQEGVSYAALVPNLKGYERARQAKVNEVSFVLAASETHNKKNINASTEEAYARYKEVALLAQKEQIPFRAYISCAFGCPYEGEVPPARVVELAERFLKLGAYEICIGDTIGVGNPVQMINLVQALKKKIPQDLLAMHLHDTRGTALANIAVALMLGLSSFDASAGGLGGCPYAPGAAGNVATEDVLYMLSGMGIDTGVDLAKVAQASLDLEQVLGKKLPSKMLAVMREQLK